jgi:hypothetical protein
VLVAGSARQLQRPVLRSDTGTPPLSLINNLPLIEGRIGNRDVRLGLDSGAQINWLSHALKDDIKANFQFPGPFPLLAPTS